MKNNYKISYPFLILFVLQFLPSFMHGQVTTFQQIYQTIKDQSGKDVLPTSDGGYLIAGTTENNMANDLDIKIMKTNNVGDTVWTKTYGSSSLNYPNCILETNDGNYFILGYSQSPGADQDMNLLKINTSGDILWSKVYGGFGNEDGKEIVATADGNYVIVGASNSLDYSNYNMQLLKIDPAGNTMWTKYYGGPNYESARSVRLCLDGGFILAGKTTNAANTIANIYLVKTDPSGDTLWTKTFGGSDSYEGKFILTNTDGSYTLCADDSSASRDSDVKVIKITGNGNIIWEKIFGGADKDICKMIQHTSDGGYIVVATSRSFGWIDPDMWLIKLTAIGDTAWTRHFGGIYHDHGYAVKSTSDGGYVAVGHNRNINSTFRVMLVKVDEFGNITPTAVEEFALNNTLNVYPNPTDGVFKIDISSTDESGVTFKISNVSGQVVFSETIDPSIQINSRIIDLADKAPGLYFLTLQSTKDVTTKKLILK